MKILLCSTTLKHTLHFRWEIITRLADHGYEIHIVSPINVENYQEKFAHKNVFFYDITVARGISGVLKEIKTLVEYRKYLQAIKPDIIFSYSVKASFLTRLVNWKIPHANFITGLGSGFLPGKYQFWMIKLFQTLGFTEKHIKPSEELFVFLNENDREFFLKEKLCEEKNTLLFPGEGVDLQYYQYSPINTSKTEPIDFLFVGRFIKDKGVLELMAACKQLKEKKLHFTCTMIAPLDAENPSHLAIPDKSEFAKANINYISSSDDVRPFLQKSDVFVLPSYAEGLPRVLLEAMAIGRPIIASDVSGCNELVENNINGFLVKARDVNTLAAAMESIIKLPRVELQLLGDAGYEKVKSKYSVESVMHNYFTLIEKLNH